MAATVSDLTTDTIAAHDAFMVPNLRRYPVVMARGAGCRLWDTDGRAYLDLFAGFGAGVLGHCHDELVAAVTEQAGRLWHAGNLFHTQPQTKAAELIAKLGFGGRSFFCHSGADANEAALKLARLYGHRNPGKDGPRYKIISTTQSFHGRSFGTMPATGNPKVREGFGPMLPGYVNVPYNDLAAVEAQLGADAVAVIAEPIQGEGGLNVPAPDYFAQLRALCDAHDLLLIADEVWTGCGRTGRHFGHQWWTTTGGSGGAGVVEPDVMTLGKGVGGGLAVGVMCASERVASCFDPAHHDGLVKHATTLGGNCIGAAATAKVLEVIERDRLHERAERLGDQAMARLAACARRAPRTGILDVRGKGLFFGVRLAPTHAAGDVVKQCLHRGLLVGSAQDNVVRLAPPLVVSEAELDEGLGILEGVLVGS